MYVTLKQKGSSSEYPCVPIGSFFFSSIRENSSPAYWFLVVDIFMDVEMGSSSYDSCVSRLPSLNMYVLVGCEIINTERFFVALFFGVSWSEAIFWRFFSTRWIWLDGLLTLFRNCLCFSFMLHIVAIRCTVPTSTPPSYVAQLLMLCFTLLFHHAGVCSISMDRNVDEWISNLGCLGWFFLRLVLWSIISISAAI